MSRWAREVSISLEDMPGMDAKNILSYTPETHHKTHQIALTYSIPYTILLQIKQIIKVLHRHGQRAHKRPTIVVLWNIKHFDFSKIGAHGVLKRKEKALKCRVLPDICNEA